MGRLFLNTYAALVATPAGREASKRFGLPPFIDGSIRREPDLGHPMPSISCLCRGGNFAPRLRPGDVVVYMTKRESHGRGTERRLTAVLRVAERFGSHDEAAACYRGRGLAVPSNCMVRGNRPASLERSHRDNEHVVEGRACPARLWDRDYADRAARHGAFLACERLWSDLGWTAPVVRKADLEAVFGEVPATRNPGALHLRLLRPLLERLRIDVPPSCP